MGRQHLQTTGEIAIPALHAGIAISTVMLRMTATVGRAAEAPDYRYFDLQCSHHELGYEGSARPIRCSVRRRGGRRRRKRPLPRRAPAWSLTYIGR